MSRAEALHAANETRGKKVVSVAERRDRLAFVEHLLVNDVGHQDCLRLCRDRFGMGESAVERTKRRVLDEWARANATRRDFRRDQQRRRLMNVILRATETRQWRSAVAAEALLARIDGLMSGPPKVAVEQRSRRLPDAIADYLASVTDEELEALHDRGEEILEAERANKLNTGGVPGHASTEKHSDATPDPCACRLPMTTSRS